jgi:hypothetical protein
MTSTNMDLPKLEVGGSILQEALALFVERGLSRFLTENARRSSGSSTTSVRNSAMGRLPTVSSYSYELRLN